MTFPLDHLIFTPHDVDLARSPLAGRIDAETIVLGAFNPGMTRLANGNLLLMVRVAEALKEPIADGHVRAVRWDAGSCVLDPWPLALVDTADPRKFMMRGGGWRVMALTSLSWLLPVEVDPEGRRVEAVHYDRAIVPAASWQCYGVEDARISRVGDRFLMTTCSVSPERHSTTLYTSDDALDWTLEGIVLDHQNKDMLIFEGLIDGKYWAQTRPLGDLYFAYPPDSEWRAGPSINLATDDGWLTLWHGVEPHGVVGVYRTYWTMLARNAPWQTVAYGEAPLIEPAPALTEPLRDLMYLDSVVFTTGIADGGDVWIVASGEADLACRITHVPKTMIG